MFNGIALFFQAFDLCGESFVFRGELPIFRRQAVALCAEGVIFLFNQKRQWQSLLLL